MVHDIFGLRRMREVADRLEGLKAPCDAELNVDSDGYTLKTSTLEDLATAATFFRDAVDGGKEDVPTCTIDVGILTPKDAENCAEIIMKRYSHFTNGGTPKKQVHIKISDIKRPKFVHSLCASTRDRKSISDRDFDEASFGWYDDKDDTHCIMKLHDLEVVGITRKHPDDTPNEYIGKSLSFNRAFAKLEDAVNGVTDKSCVGTAATSSTIDNYVNINTGGCIHRCIAGADIGIGDEVYVGHGGRVYPKKSELSFYHGGIDFACESTCGCTPDGLVIIDDELCKVGTSKTESEDVSKESKESDDITITMSRKKASYVADAMAGGFNVNDVHRQILDAIRK